MSLSSDNASKMLASAVSGTSLLIFVQLASRIFIFLSNQLILRSLSPSILGIAAQLELFLISILYFSRESIRAAIQRQPLVFNSPPPLEVGQDDSAREEHKRTQKAQLIASQSVVNMSYLSLGIGILLATAFAAFYMHFAPEEVLESPLFHLSVVFTAIASLIELSSEPFFALMQQHMLYKKRAAVEISAAFTKSLIICGVSTWATWSGHNLGAFPFALGYLFYSFTLVSGYFLVTIYMPGDRAFSLLPVQINPRDKSKYFFGRFPRTLVSLSANVFFQSIVKHVLTQGDSMILAAMTSLEDQGIYSLASNYGGLLARIIFQPIEENSRTIYSSLLNSKGPQNQELNIRAAKAHLLNIMRGYMMLSALIFPLGPTLGPRILHVLGGRRWANPDVDSLLALYCYYIPFLAFNGISEAFVASTASPAQLRKQTGWMGMFSACFALAAYLFLKIGGLGAHGLLYANIVNMGVRIVWSFSFIQHYFHREKFDIILVEFNLQPQTYIVGAIVMALLFRDKSPSESSGDLAPFFIGAVYVLLV